MLQHGVYPSKVCRRIAGIEPTMTVKAQDRRHPAPGEGRRRRLRHELRGAVGPRRIAVIPVGYGDGFPRVRNQGCVLIGGRRAPLVGGVAMDAFMVDTTDLPEVRLWDEVVLMGPQGAR